MTLRTRSISCLIIPFAIACSSGKDGESGPKDPVPVNTGGTSAAGSGGANSGGTDAMPGGAPPATGGQATGGTTSDDPTLPGYTLEWADEFDIDGPPNPEHWNILEWPAGQTNDELQEYTNSSETLRVEEGVLVIEAHHDPERDSPYTSGRVFGSGKKDILYGRIDVRAKLPSGRGTWPAIWMMPTSPEAYGSWPDSGEIDVMEHVGFDMNVVHSAVHTEAFNWQMGTQKTTHMDVPNVATEFHVYRLDWTAEGLWTYVDDVPLFHFANEQNGSATWPFDQPFHLIMNIAIGGNWGGQQGIDNSIFPQRMEIDYVRVYKPE